MKVQQLQHRHIREVVSLLTTTMPWAPSSSKDIAERANHCPNGQCVVLDEAGRVIGYGFMLRTKASKIEGNWYLDTGNGVGETHLDRGNVAYVGSTVWDPSVPTVVRQLASWYRAQAEAWRVKQVMGFSRIPSLSRYSVPLRPGDVHDLVLDGLDPLTRVYRRLGFEPAVPQPNYSELDKESAGYGMLMVSSV